MPPCTLPAFLSQKTRLINQLEAVARKASTDIHFTYALEVLLPEVLQPLVTLGTLKHTDTDFVAPKDTVLHKLL